MAAYQHHSYTLPHTPSWLSSDFVVLLLPCLFYSALFIKKAQEQKTHSMICPVSNSVLRYCQTQVVEIISS